MKKKTLQPDIHLLAIVLIAIFISAYSNPEDDINIQQFVWEKKTSPSPDLDTIRKRIVDDLLEPSVDADKIKKLITTIRPDGSWPGINYEDTSRTGFQHSEHLANMLDLARAYKKQGSEFYGNPEVKRTVSSALDFWIMHDFICENWWWNEMGTPNFMINTLLLLDDALTEKQRTEGARIASRASLTGFGARAGGDFVPIAGMVVKQGLFKQNDSIVEKALKVMNDQVKVTTGRGIKPDLSFHHRVDNVISIHTYGTNYVSSFNYWAVKTAGTKYKLPETSLKLLIDYYLDGICKSMAYQKYPDPGAKNRDLSRRGTLDPADTDIPENFLQTTDYRKKELEEVIKIRKGEKENNLTWNRYFWHSSYFTHQRKNYFTSVRMHSSRQNNMEEPYNEEGLKMHHIADGANFISRTGREYVGIFPVMNWQKIPGTTVVQKPSLPHWNQIAKKGLSDFVGAVSDGEFGAAAFDFKSVHDPLKAHKAWFFFDREYVCLGTGIHSEADYPVATTLNQCLLKGNVLVKTNKGTETLQRGEHTIKDVNWIIHDSVAYLFPAPAIIHVNNTSATGNWRQINHQAWATEEQVQMDVFTLWLDHGQKPDAAGYAYMVAPGANAASADLYSGNKQRISILANTPEMQAVQHNGLQITQVVFYQPGTISLSNALSLTAENSCIVMVRMDGKKIEKIAVSDPTQKLNSLQLKINVTVTGSGNNWRATWDKQNKWSTIQVDLPKEGEAGKSVVLNISGKKKS
ncbi:MAG: chondroitin lyase [Flavisolibacter sp.]|nr:chondroitin lyase [Flavisolibacter sp.]